MSKRWDEDKVYRAFVDMYGYNYEPELIQAIYDKAVEEYESHDAFCVLHISMGDVADEWQDNEGLNFVWGMLVLMYGDYGVAPRVGWLEVSKELIDFLKDMIEDLKD